MSDPVSALGGASFDGLIRITEAGPRGMVTVRGDLASPKLEKAVFKATGCPMPARRGAVSEGEHGVCWMSPDELLLLVPHAQASAVVAALDTALKGEHALVVDVSDARASFVLDGTSGYVRETLAKLTPADMRTSALPVGALRRTRLAQVPAAIYFTTDTRAEVICFRSVAAYVFGLLKTAAEPGSEVMFFPQS